MTKRRRDLSRERTLPRGGTRNSFLEGGISHVRKRGIALNERKLIRSVDHPAGQWQR